MADKIGSFNPPVMKWSGTQEDRVVAFKRFKQRCNLLFGGILVKLKPEEQANCLIYWLDDEGLDIINSFTLSDDDKKKPDEIFKAFETYFKPKSNFRIQRYKLNRFRQDPDETVDSYYARCRNQALKCNFSTDDELESRLIEQLIIGTNCVETKKALLGKDEKLTVDQALDCARRKESTRNDLRDLDMYDKPGQDNMEGATKIDAAYWERKRKHKKKKSKKSKDKEPEKEINAFCFNCGRSHGRSCPAYGFKCLKCHGYNHYAKMCQESSSSESSDDEETHAKAKGAKGGARRGQHYHQAGFENYDVDEGEDIIFGAVKIEEGDNGNESDDFVFG